MPRRKNDNSGDTVKEEIALFDKAETLLLVNLSKTENVTLLRKIYASGFLREHVIGRLIELMDKGVADACLEIMQIYKESKGLDKDTKNRMAYALGDK